MNVERQHTVWKLTSDRMILVICNEYGKTTHCLKTHKWSDDISNLQWMWKDNALFENSQLIRWYKSFAINVERFLGRHTVWKLKSDRMKLVICNECGKTMHCLKTHKWSNDISHLQLMWKDNKLFENSQVIRWYESSAINVERFLGRRTVWKLTSDRMILVICNECGKTTHCLKTHKWSDDISHLQLMWRDLQDNALFENSQVIGWYE